MSKILIVYEEVPEKTTLFKVELTDEQEARYGRLHGMYINSNIMDQELEDIANELYAKLFFVENEYPKRGPWAHFEVTTAAALGTPVDGVLLTGFLL